MPLDAKKCRRLLQGQLAAPCRGARPECWPSASRVSGAKSLAVIRSELLIKREVIGPRCGPSPRLFAAATAAIDRRAPRAAKRCGLRLFRCATIRRASGLRREAAIPFAGVSGENGEPAVGPMNTG